NSNLYTNLVLAATGSAVACFPNALERTASGLRIGADKAGNNQAKGAFDEVETFNYPLSAIQVDSGLGGNGGLDPCQPILGPWEPYVWPMIAPFFCSPDPCVVNQTMKISGAAATVNGIAYREVYLCGLYDYIYSTWRIDHADLSWSSQWTSPAYGGG